MEFPIGVAEDEAQHEEFEQMGQLAQVMVQVRSGQMDTCSVLANPWI
jgi:hypothetical protein